MYEDLYKVLDKYESLNVVYEYFVLRAGGEEYVNKNGIITSYIEPVIHFSRFNGYGDPDKLLDDAKAGKLDLTQMIIDWRRKLIRDGRAPKTLHRYNSGLKKWLDLNDILEYVDWNRVKKKAPLPVGRVITEDRIPTKEELRKIILNAGRKMRTLIMIAATSGIRIGALIRLKLGDIDLESYPDIAIIKIRPELSKNRIGYYTLITGEARKILEEYLEWRRKKGDKLDEDSWLFPSKDPSKHIKYKSVGEDFRRILKRTGLAVKARKSHFHEIHLHSLRKFFRSMLEGYLTKSEIMRLMGQAGEKGEGYLDGAYFRPLEKELIEKYRAAQFRLSILEEKMPMHEKREVVRSLLKIFAPMIGLSELEIEEILKRTKNLDEITEKIREKMEFKKLKTNGGIKRKDIIIVRSEKELIKKLEEGYEIVRELNDGRIILRSP